MNTFKLSMLATLVSLSFQGMAGESVNAYQASIERKSSALKYLPSSVLTDVLDTVLDNAQAPARAASTAASDAIRGGKDTEIQQLKVTKQVKVNDINAKGGVVKISDTDIEDTKANKVTLTQDTKLNKINSKNSGVLFNNITLSSFKGGSVSISSNVRGGNVNAKNTMVSVGNTNVGRRNEKN